MNKLFYILGWPLLLAANVFSQTPEAPYAGCFGLNGLAQVVVAGQALYIDSNGNTIQKTERYCPWKVSATKAGP